MIICAFNVANSFGYGTLEQFELGVMYGALERCKLFLKADLNMGETTWQKSKILILGE